jgi:hypothetical protein
MHDQARGSTSALRVGLEAAPTHRGWGGTAGERVRRGQSGAGMRHWARGNTGASSLWPGEEQHRGMEAGVDG